MFKRPLSTLAWETRQATTYEEWSEYAQSLDHKHGQHLWKRKNKTRLYDYRLIKSRVDELQELRRAKDAAGILFALNEGIHGNMGGMGRPQLYQVAKFGTKNLINEYVDELIKALDFLAHASEREVRTSEKLEFFRRASHCFGRTALMLSGSGNLFYFHLGVVKALWEQELLPSVISGASGGAFVAALIGTHTPDELEKIFDPRYLELEVQSNLDQAMSGKGRKRFQQVSQISVERFLTRLIPDITFQEAAELSGVNINVSVAPALRHQSSRLLNAIASPTVMIHEALLASSAMPGFYPPVTLMAKDRRGKRKPYQPQYQWIDGSVSDDLPIKRVMRLYGVNHTVVSQTNPLVLPFLSEPSSSEALNRIREIVSFSTKQWILWSTNVLDKRAGYHSSLGKALHYARGVVSQTYTGDINIFPPTRLHNPADLLSNRSAENILKLIKHGERATWSKIEAIRIQTTVSRRLDEILEVLEKRVISQSDETLRQSIRSERNHDRASS